MSAQLTFFVFKLRQNIQLEGDLTLAKMELDAFVPGGVEAVDNINDVVKITPQLQGLNGLIALNSHVRKNGIQAYITHEQPLNLLHQLIYRISFVQSIYCVTRNTEKAQAFLTELKLVSGPVITYQIEGGTLIIRAIPHYALIELSDVIARRSENTAEAKHNLHEVLNALTGQSTSQKALKLTHAVLSAQSTTSHLSHDLHYYKAKFFPRLVRSMLNVCAQRLGNGTHRVIDNFVGSGTTLLEVSMLDMPSVGLDIDPLSVIIARTKMDVLQLKSSCFSDEAERIIRALETQATGQLELFENSQYEAPHTRITFPSWLMKNRRMTLNIAEILSQEIATVQSAIELSHPKIQDIFRVFMSDAISRKIRMRFLGTGVGRFSLTFAKDPIPHLFAQALRKYAKVLATYEVLRKTINLHFADAEVIAVDTRSIPENIGSFDILVTSPPYLPAASGRESYAMARAPSLIATGLRTCEEVDHLIEDSVGSMSGNGVELTELSDDERHIVDWLQHDTLRAIKATPTARYFLDMRRSFAEMYRVLQPGAIAVVVSGKQSTFYEFSSRKPFYIVRSAELLADEASRIGFDVEALLDIQLQKSNRNARPRSLDDYYETLIILRK